ncbi:type II toxin-antitoxin system RelE/ParE family toxin [Paratractidigestivibacter faecalis]|uniref:Type II toxin-antitoxin system RelE/ParE family toxin n=1 Tax=Paratractidigestivibacter faecalis TaxID=2292441 RepID=A0ABV1IEW2_9ACTN
MIVLYSDKKLEGICTDEGKCRRFRSDLVNGVKRRHNALEVAESLEDFARIDPSGRWHRLSGNRDGQWSGRLTGNYRIIVEPVPGGMRVVAVKQAVKVLSIEDYH